MDDASSPPSLERARADPGAVSVPDAASHLDADDGADRKTAADVLYEVAKADPVRLAEDDTVPDLVATLDDPDSLVRESAALALAAVAAETDAVAPHADALAAALDDEYAIVADALASALREVATSSPTALADSVPELCAHLDADLDSTRFHLLSALVGVAGERPERIDPAVEALLEVADGRDPHDDPSEASGQPGPAEASGASGATPGGTGAPGAVEPGAGTGGPGSGPGTPAQEDEDVEASIVEAALAVLATMAAERPAEAARMLGPHVPTFRVLLDDPHAGIRSVSAATLAAIAEHDPAAVEPATDDLTDRLTDHATVVAANAVWALRYLDTPRARTALREADPDHDDVRAVIEAALADREE